MSRYKPYLKYKDSGMDWFGKIPEHWSVGLLSSLFSDNKEKNTGLKNSNLLSLSYGNIIRKDIDTSTGLLPESFESYQIVHPGYIVLRLTDLQNDKKSLRTGFVKETGIITSAYTGLAKKSKSIGNEKYFYLYLHTFDAHKGFYGMGAGVRQGLNFDELKKMKFALPPLEEQNLIVDRVEKETAKIDTLIAKQERMIELLGEKRQALISHAVTKGLDPSVKMKDSGIEWLGEVPEHWEVKRLKFLCKITTGSKDTVNAKEDGEYPFYVRSQTVERIDSYSYDGEAILTAGDGAGVGKVFHYVDGKFDFHQRVYMFYDFDAINGKFLFEYIKSNLYKVALEGGAKSTVDSLRLPLLQNFEITIPTDNEQLKIVEHISMKAAKIDTLIQKAKQAIELLKERRTALISAAVTGKIDVRNIEVI